MPLSALEVELNGLTGQRFDICVIHQSGAMQRCQRSENGCDAVRTLPFWLPLHMNGDLDVVPRDRVITASARFNTRNPRTPSAVSQSSGNLLCHSYPQNLSLESF